MRAALLCPGPSLAAYAPRAADVVIAVNRAALAFPCDWWAATDYPMVRDNFERVQGRPNLLTRKQTLADVAKRPARIQRFGEVRLVDDLDGYCPPDLGYGRFSATAALVFAASTGATAIDVFGADWAGALDFDRIAAGEDRSDERWLQEATIWEGALVPWLSDRGVRVRRLVAQGSL